MKLSPLVNLDFEQIKLQLKYFLKNNTKFSDYNYEGSNINQLLDVLAYVTFLNSFQLNLGLNELNLETATLRDNVNSKAQELGYTPNNYNCAKISVFLTFDVPKSAKFVEIPSGMICVGTNSETNLAYKFNLPERIILPSKNGIIESVVELYEGTLIDNQYTYDIVENSRIILTNNNIDLNTIRVTVNNISFYKYNNLITDVSNIFYTSILQDSNIEIEFGKNIFGNEPNIGDIVTVSYLTNNGESGNEINNLNFVGNCKYYFENNNIGISISLENIIFYVNGSSAGGTNTETLKNIKFSAIRHYAAQNRAVVASDYQSIIINNFPYINHVNVIGGEELIPPQYGKVKLILQTNNSSNLNNTQKDSISKLLKKFNITTIPIITDAKYAKLKIKSYIKYNLKLLSKNIDELRYKITKIISDYTNIEDFGSNFYGHKLESLIYAADKSILSVKIKLIIVDTPISNNDNFYGSIGNGVKNDNCKLYSFLSTPFLSNDVYYRLVVMGDSSVINRQKYIFDGNTYNWQNDSVVGHLNPLTGAYDYTTNVSGSDISIISIPADIDIETTDTILVPKIYPPNISTEDTDINYDITAEEEYKEPTITKIGVLTGIPIDNITIDSIIPVLSSIVC